MKNWQPQRQQSGQVSHNRASLSRQDAVSASVAGTTRDRSQLVAGTITSSLSDPVAKVLAVLLWITLSGFPPDQAMAQDLTSIESASQSFKFISNTLQSYRRSGSINEEIGVPADRLTEFVGVLQESYESFTESFGPDSGFCNFYHAPNNAIMEIEQRAGLAFRFLPSLNVRLESYRALDQEFVMRVGAIFGDSVVENIQRVKPATARFEYLPVVDMLAGDVVNFADTACR